MTDQPDPTPHTPGHVPVLPDQVLSLLDPQPGEVMLDCTVGRGGHAGLILPKLAPGGRYIALDADPANAQYVRDRFPDPPVPLDVLHADFAEAEPILKRLDLPGVDLLLADLGFASTQMDDPERGFSFSAGGPLDMRLDTTQPRTAADLVNSLPEHELADMIYQYGEERLSRRIARKIVDARRQRPIRNTDELAQICAQAYGPRGRHHRIHPATRTFMALRIAVNDELGQLKRLLEMLERIVRPGGRVAIISFHSLEDRRVKQAFRAMSDDGKARRLTKKPVTPDESELAVNPRSRSAKLRAIRFMDGTVGRPNC